MKFGGAESSEGTVKLSPMWHVTGHRGETASTMLQRDCGTSFQVRQAEHKDHVYLLDMKQKQFRTLKQKKK